MMSLLKISWRSVWRNRLKDGAINGDGHPDEHLDKV